MQDSVDEQPKAAVAKKVISANKKYFVPTAGQEVEADTPEEAFNAVSNKTSDNKKDEKVGDGQ